MLRYDRLDMQAFGISRPVVHDPATAKAPAPTITHNAVYMRQMQGNP